MSTSTDQLAGKFTRDITLSKPDDMDSDDVTGICVLSKSKLVVVDGDCVKLIDLDNSEVLSEFQMQITAWDVTKVSDNQVAVTLPFDKKIKQLTIDAKGQFLNNPDTTAGDLCYGIQYYDRSIFASHCGSESRIEILDMEDDLILKTYRSDETANLIIERPEYIALNTDSANIYVSDWMNQTVTSMTLEGKVNAIATDFEEPKGITTNKEGSVFICDYASSKIYAMKEDLSERNVLLDSSDGINAPQCVAYSDFTHQLFIGQENSNVIKVFDIVK